MSISQPQSRASLCADFIAAQCEKSDPGARLGTKEELRLKAGVSPGTFNEALRLVHTMGIVDVRRGPGGGIFASARAPRVRLGDAVIVLDDDETAVQQAIRLRDAIEPLIVLDAIEHATAPDIAAMRQRVDELDMAGRSGDMLDMAQATWRVHAAICDVSPNQGIRALYRQLLDQVERHAQDVRIMKPPPADPEAPRGRVGLHAELVDAIEQRDRARAWELLELHRSSSGLQDHAGVPPGRTV